MIIQSCCASSRCRRKPSTVVTNRATAKFSTPTAPQRAHSLQQTPQKLTTNQLLSRSISEVEPVEDYRFVDISDQNLGSLPEFISENSNEIEHLILDGNEFSEHALEDIPRLEKLTSLSLNSNKVKNIGVLLQFLARQCPNLRFLSLIGNPGWPHPIINPNFELYHKYAQIFAHIAIFGYMFCGIIIRRRNANSALQHSMNRK